MQYFKDLQDDDDEITIFSSDKERDDYLKGRYGSDYQVEAGEPKRKWIERSRGYSHLCLREQNS